MTSLIRSLHDATGGDVLGRAFQGHAAVRRITQGDHAVLAAYARPLALEPRARLLPEERLEALLVPQQAAVARLLRDEPSGVAEERRRYLVAQASVATRDRRLTAELRDLYAGTCQLCGWAPRRSYGVDLCEAHHVRWLSRGAGTSWPTWCWSAPTTTAPSTDWTRRSTTAPAASCSGQARNVSAACSMS